MESLFEDASKLLKNVNRRLCILEENYQDFKKEIRKESKEREYLERIAGLELAMERREHLLVQTGDRKLLLEKHLLEAQEALGSLLELAEKQWANYHDGDTIHKARTALTHIENYWT